MANWIIRSSIRIKPLCERMMGLLLKAAVIHADETALRILKRNGEWVDGQSRCWVFCSGKDSECIMALYLYYPTRSAKVGTSLRLSLPKSANSSQTLSLSEHLSR